MSLVWGDPLFRASLFSTQCGITLPSWSLPFPVLPSIPCYPIRSRAVPAIAQFQFGTWHMCSCVRWLCANGGRQRRGRLTGARLQIPSQTPSLAVAIRRQYLQGGNLVTSQKVPFPLRYFPQKQRPSVAAQVKTTAQCIQLICEIMFYQHAKSYN